MQIIIAIIVLGVLVIIHESGHFFVAKMFNVKVHEFSIGMGPQVAKLGKGETMYSIRALPIGGYVKMEGEDEHSEDERAFNNKPSYQKLAVIVAGPVMNFFLALLIFMLLTSFLPFIQVPVIGEIVEDSPAQGAGLLEGDRIVEINNNKIHIQNDVFFYLSDVKDKQIEIVVERDKNILNYTLTPEYMTEYGRSMIGYSPETVKPNFFNVVYNGYYESLFFSKVILTSFADLVTGKLGTDQISGPVGIVTTIGEASQQGFNNLLFLAAFISISFGIFNLLPLPALDGGRTLFILLEMVRRKPIDPEKEGIVHFVGFALLIALMIFVTYNDIVKLITN